MTLPRLHRDITTCQRCPRLRAHCEEVAREKRRAYLNEPYWGKPVAGFGDPEARLVIVGLAPAAHGANRTGRVFTGDRSGEWLYRALHRAGFANQAESTGRDDGLILHDAYVTCAIKCAPPGNVPLPEEHAECRPYLARELALLRNAEVYLALGGIALKALLAYLREIEPEAFARGAPRLHFEHGASMRLPSGKLILCSYHPSQQNTFTGRLTQPMFDQVFRTANAHIAG